MCENPATTLKKHSLLSMEESFQDKAESINKHGMALISIENQTFSIGT